MIKIVFFMVLSLNCSLGYSATSDRLSLYDMSDLEVLLKENNYSEFFKHAEDIRPSKRDKTWSKMYQEMALIMSSDFLKNKRYTSDDYRYFENVGKRTESRKDEIFQFKRNLYILNYFKFKLKNTDLDRNLLTNEILSYLETSNKDPDIYYELYKISKALRPDIASWKFVSTLANDQISPIYCQRPEIIKEILNKIAEENFKKESQSSTSNLKELINLKCEEAMIKKLSDKLSGTELLLSFSQVEFDLGLALLAENFKNRPQDLDFLYTLFMVNGPVTGSNMNLAWNRITELSQSNQKREIVLKRIKELSFFPDGLFYDPNLTRSKAVITHLKKNFPEVINHYSELCLKKINGENTGVKISEYNCRQFLK